MKRMIPHTTCRMCHKPQLVFAFSLGMTPLANAFLTREQLDEPEYFYPLDLYLCQHCGLLQLGHVVSPEVLFGNYVYVSSTSAVFRKHFANYAADSVKRFSLTGKDFIVDIGSNDGVLLKPFKELGIKVLGIEPAEKIADVARTNGVPTESEFITTQLATKIVDTHGKVSVVTANNVFAHIDNLDEVVQSVKILLRDDGVFIIEAPYLVDFLEKTYFDLVYHEHISYLALMPLVVFFKRFDMEVFDVIKTDAHGGSIRVFVKKSNGPYPITNNVKTFISQEKSMRLAKGQTWKNFEKKILKNKADVVKLLVTLKLKGKHIAAYGAPAKGNTLLTYFGIGKTLIDFLVDDSSWIQRLFTPGTHIPVVSSETLYQKKPDYLLILAWNFAPSIMHMHKKYHTEGGRFIIPVPRPHVVENL